jgi:hypothetical protein
MIQRYGIAAWFANVLSVKGGQSMPKPDKIDFSKLFGFAGRLSRSPPL